MSFMSDEALDHWVLKNLENRAFNEQKKAAEDRAKAEAVKLKKYKDQAVKQFNQEWTKLEQPLENDLKVIQEPLQHLEKLHHQVRSALIGCRLGIRSSIDRIVDDPQAWDLFQQSNALHVAADANQKPLLEFLLNKGFSVHSRDFNGRLPVDLAIEKGNVELAEFLQKLQLGDLLKDGESDSLLTAFIPESQIPKEVSESCDTDILAMLDKVQDKLKSRPSRKDHDEVRKVPELSDDAAGKPESIQNKLNALAILREQELALDSLVKFLGYKNKAADFLDHYHLQLDKMKAVYALYYHMLEANPYNILMLTGFLLCRNFLQEMHEPKVKEDVETQMKPAVPEEKLVSKVLDYLLNQWALHQLLNEIGFESLEKSIDYIYKHPIETQYQSIFDFVNDTTIVSLMLSTKLSCYNKETFLQTQDLAYYQQGLKLAFSQDFQGCLGGSDEDLLDSIPFIEEIARNFIIIHQQGGKAAVLQQLRESIKSQLGIKTLAEIMRQCRSSNCYQVKDKEIDSIVKEYNIDLIDPVADEYVTHSLVYAPVFREIAAEQDLVRQEKQKIDQQRVELAKMKAQDYQGLLVQFKNADAVFQKAKTKQAQIFNGYENALKQHQAERARIVERNNKNTVIGFGINVGLGGSGSSLSFFPSMRLGNHHFTLDPAYINSSRPGLQLNYGNASSCSLVSKEPLIHAGEKAVDKALIAALHQGSNPYLGLKADEAMVSKGHDGAFHSLGLTAFTSNTKNHPLSNLQILASNSKTFDYMFERVTHNIENLVCTSPMYAKQQPPVLFSDNGQAALKKGVVKAALKLANETVKGVKHYLGPKYAIYDATTGLYTRTKSSIEEGNNSGRAFSCAALGQSVEIGLARFGMGAVWGGSSFIAAASAAGGPLSLAGGLLLGGLTFELGTKVVVAGSKTGGDIAQKVCQALHPKNGKPN